MYHISPRWVWMANWHTQAGCKKLASAACWAATRRAVRAEGEGEPTHQRSKEWYLYSASSKPFLTWVIVVVYRLLENAGNFSWNVNGKRFFGSSNCKIPEMNGSSEKVVPFSWLERFEWISLFHLQVPRFSHQFQTLDDFSYHGYTKWRVLRSAVPFISVRIVISPLVKWEVYCTIIALLIRMVGVVVNAHIWRENWNFPGFLINSYCFAREFRYVKVSLLSLYTAGISTAHELPNLPTCLQFEPSKLHRWEDSDVRLLISCWSDYKHLFRGKATNKDIFDKIATEFNTKSSRVVSREECMRKWWKIVSKQKEIEDHNNKTGNDKKSWKFYDELSQCLAKDTSGNPVCTMESSLQQSDSKQEDSNSQQESDLDESYAESLVGATSESSSSSSNQGKSTTQKRSRKRPKSRSSAQRC